MSMNTASPAQVYDDVINFSTERVRDVKQKLASSNGEFTTEQQKQIIEALQKFDDLTPSLEKFDDVRMFAKAWFLRTVGNELLKLSIEDDLLNLVALRSIVDPLEELLGDDWLSPPLERIFEQLLQLPKRPRIKTYIVRLRLTSGVQIVGRLAKPGEPKIPVSSDRFLFVPILEDSIASNMYAPGIVDAYTARLQQISEQEKITHLCFIEKTAGPVGALGLLSTLTTKLNLPAFVYRPGRWPEWSTLSGSFPGSRNGKASVHPHPDSRVALVYDLLVTGGALKQAAVDLRQRFETEVTSAVVLFGYKKDIHKKNRFSLDYKHGKMRVDAIGWYEDYLPEIEEIYGGNVKPTKHLAIINPNGRSDSPVETGESDASPQNGDRTMENRFPFLRRLSGSYLRRSVNGHASVVDAREDDTLKGGVYPDWHPLETKPYPPAAIANEFLKLAVSSEQLLTPASVQALTYLAHGWHLGIAGTPLIDEHIIAWDHGPVIFSLFVRLIGYGNRPITSPIKITVKPGNGSKLVAPVLSLSDEEVHALLGSIWEAYRDYSDYQLAAVISSSESPWYRTVHDPKSPIIKGAPIEMEVLKDYFRTLAKKWALI